MYSLVKKREDLCVVRVDRRVLQTDGVMITDMNASRSAAQFRPYPQGLSMIDAEMVYASSWYDEDENERYVKKGIKCAEALVPDQVSPGYIAGIKAPSGKIRVGVLLRVWDLEFVPPVEVDTYVFFK